VSVGDQIRVLVRPSEFAPPGDLTTPMLLIGPGTGVAPFMGFLEQRQALLEQQDMMATEAAPVWLYFGCRNQSHFLHHKQLHEWQEEQLLARLRVAFSRKPKRKQYVQDLLRLDQNELWAFLCRPDCRVYICGDTQMAEDVTQVLVSIAHDVGEMTIAESASWLASLRAEGRWATDVWSSVLSLPAHKGE
jgi:sulfite reductase alpha subunit-like flavoprotein